MLSDLRFAVRSLLKTPGFTVVALLTLALGIGVNTSMFTAINTMLFQQLPFAAPGRLVRVFRTAPQSQRWPHAVANYLDVQAQSHSFTSLAGYVWSNCNFAAAGQPAERLRGMDVTGEFFPLLGIGAELGRTFSPEETRADGPPVVVLSHPCWVSRFNADPAIIGRQLRIDGSLVTVVGVMPASFVPPLLWIQIDLWRPMIFTAKQAQNRENNYMSIIGRLAPGVTVEAAATELAGIAARLAKDYPLVNTNNGLRPLLLADSSQDDTSRYLSWFVMGLAGFVLLIACANLANLQFARTAGRAREHAIRLALGAPRWRIMRELLAESLLLALVGGAAGLLVALWCNDLVGARIVIGPTAGLKLSLDPRVFVFTLAASSLSGLALGLLPAWSAARSDVNETLKQQARGSTADRSHHRVRQALIVTEVALALVLLTGAGVFIRGLQHFTVRDPGWQTEDLLAGNINLPSSRYPDHAARSVFFQRLEEGLAASPVVSQAALTSSLPIWGYSSSTSFVVEDQPAPKQGTEPLSNLVFVNPRFFDTLGLRLRHGRGFTADDRADKTRVVVINEAMARAFWPGQDPVGRRLGDPDPNDRNWLEIVGVVSDADSPAQLTPPDTRFQMYRPIAQDSFSFALVAVRGRASADLLGAELRRVVSAIDPDQPVHNIVTVRGEIDRGLANFNLAGQLLGGFALMGVALAAIGIYGVLAGFVAQRRQEIGVRLALGAQVRDVLGLVLGRGMLLAGLGVVIGLLGAFGIVRVLEHILPVLGSPDPLAVAGVIALLLGVAFLACWLPARRATRVNPLEALRAE